MAIAKPRSRSAAITSAVLSAAASPYTVTWRAGDAAGLAGASPTTFSDTILGPLASGACSKVTRWPGLTVARPEVVTAAAGKKMSVLPPSGVTKPNPLDALKNLTMPVVMPLQKSKKVVPKGGSPGDGRV